MNTVGYLPTYVLLLKRVHSRQIPNFGAAGHCDPLAPTPPSRSHADECTSCVRACRYSNEVKERPRQSEWQSECSGRASGSDGVGDGHGAATAHGDGMATAWRRRGDGVATALQCRCDGGATGWRRHTDGFATTWRRGDGVVCRATGRRCRATGRRCRNRMATVWGCTVSMTP